MSTYDANYYEELQGRLRAILILVGAQLPQATVEIVNDLVDNNEAGIALDMISEMLVESGARLDESVVADVATLAAQMGLAEETAARLKPLIIRDPSA